MEHGQLRMLPEPLMAYDKDVGINSSVVYSWSGSGPQYTQFSVDSGTGEVAVTGDLTGDQLRQPVTLIVQATQQDNKDRYSIIK